MPKNTRVPGHTLTSEGRGFQQDGCESCKTVGRLRSTWNLGTSGSGHAKCSCGVMSEHLPSGTQRRKWHAEHKGQVKGARV